METDRRKFLGSLLVLPAALLGARTEREPPLIPKLLQGWVHADDCVIDPNCKILDAVTGEELSDVFGMNIEAGQLDREDIGDWGLSHYRERRPFIYIDGAGRRWDSQDYAH